MIANTYLSLDFPKQTGIFANSSKKGVNDIEIQRKYFLGLFIGFSLGKYRENQRFEFSFFSIIYYILYYEKKRERKQALFP